MINEINVKISYILNHEIKEGNMKLNFDDNLEKAFNKYLNIKSAKNKQKEREFYLKRENKKILLDKEAKIKDLNLKEGDSISVNYKDNNINILKNTSQHFNINASSGNLNLESSTNSSAEKPLKKRKNTVFYVVVEY